MLTIKDNLVLLHLHEAGALLKNQVSIAVDLVRRKQNSKCSCWEPMVCFMLTGPVQTQPQLPAFVLCKLGITSGMNIDFLFSRLHS